MSRHKYDSPQYSTSHVFLSYLYLFMPFCNLCQEGVIRVGSTLLVGAVDGGWGGGWNVGKCSWGVRVLRLGK